MEKEWRCTHCRKLLGIRDGNRLHLKFSRGHEYLVGMPVTGVCRGCRTLNELTEPRPTGPPGRETSGDSQSSTC